MGDHSIPHLRPGDLIVNVNVRPHPVFRREGESIIYEHAISVWDALLGTTVNIRTLDGKQLTITIPQGTQPDTILSCRGEGLPHVRTRQRGNLLLKIKISIPKTLTPTQLTKLQEIKNGL